MRSKIIHLAPRQQLSLSLRLLMLTAILCSLIGFHAIANGGNNGPFDNWAAGSPAPAGVIKGRVVDKAGLPVEGASVVVAGSKQGTTTNSNGRFTLTIPDGQNVVLEVSSVGFQTLSLSVGQQTDVIITLEEESTGLNQVVVIGYGTKRKKDLTGAISSISANELQRVPTTSFTASIAGKVPGVVITQTSGAPGGASSVRIRGVGTTGGNQPLYVIDGVPMGTGSAGPSNSSLGTGSVGVPGSSYGLDAMSSINPSDIESI
ncbi:MAG TPA: carboxypeptidase-like regulatory domain-containing protein, partial [Chitinophagaceae bacterium]|nr:carboxypeptidase-like regulatory domain-containing protein [Chitinophagaceae bacterium]